jgi:hypothetical protein
LALSPCCERELSAACSPTPGSSSRVVICQLIGLFFTLRASLRASVSNCALAPLRRDQAQSSAISRIMPSQWRRKGGRWHMANSISSNLTQTCKRQFQIIVTRVLTK